MTGYWKKAKPQNKTSEKPSFLAPIKNYTMPRALYNRLKEHAERLELPITRLISYAIYNELEVENPFNFDMTMPNEPYVEGEYVIEASRLLDLIKEMPDNKGLGLDQLVMAKEAARIYDKKTLLLAYRELIEVEMVYNTHPSEFRIPGHYPKDFVQVAPVKINYKTDQLKNKTLKSKSEVPINDIINKK